MGKMAVSSRRAWLLEGACFSFIRGGEGAGLSAALAAKPGFGREGNSGRRTCLSYGIKKRPRHDAGAGGLHALSLRRRKGVIEV